MKRIAQSVLCGVFTVGIGLSTIGTPAGAATAVVGNGLTTTDLNAVGMSPGSLASALVGPGVSVSNVTYTGANAQAGLIHIVDPAVVSFNDGIILSSGNIADVVGPNKSDSTTGNMGGPGDADLNSLIANTQTVNPTTFDAASLQFDFVPTANHVYFTYTFGSDEYLEWVNLFNDVFAFYVNGQNCATVPSGAPVSIDTINNVVNPNLFRDNSFSAPPPNPINIEPDGLSVEMICSAPVNAGQVNHMKLAIADTSDPILDSVVMIKAQSLSTVQPESCNDGVDNNGDGLVDMADPKCQATTTPPPIGQGGIGSSGNPPAFTGNEGTPISLDASVLGWAPAVDTVTTEWTVHGINGTTATCAVTPAGPVPLNPGGSIPVASTICANEGEYVASVNGLDSSGNSTFDDNVDFFVHNAPPAVTISAPLPNAQAAVGTPVGVSATVTDPGPNDTVTCAIDWGDGTSEPGTLVNSTCTGSHAYAAAGPQVLSVTATDNANASGATATVLSVTGTVTSPAVLLASSANPSHVSESVTFTAHASGAPLHGVVTFSDGATVLGTRTASGGVATLVIKTLGLGDHAITATATGFVGSAVLTQHVDPAVTVTTLSSTANPSVYAQATAFKATVKRQLPATGTVTTGTIDFLDNGVLLATKNVASGAATFSTKTLGVGSHPISAVYSGATTNSGSSSPLTQVVVPAPTTVKLTASPGLTSVFGQKVPLKAVVTRTAPSSGPASGTVDFYDELGPIALAVPLSGAGVATFPVPNLPVGTHVLHADYSGSATEVLSHASVTQVVGAASTKTTLARSRATAKAGAVVTLTATVKAVAPSLAVPDGAVAVLDGGNPAFLANVVAGKVVITTTALTVGLHTLTAQYLGNGSFTGSVSLAVTITIT